MLGFTRSFMRRARNKLTEQMNINQSQHDLLIRAEWARSISASKNPLNGFGAKYFSQADEDGITLEIVRRIGIGSGTFVELGVGSGIENNTLVLLASGWRGFWIGDEDLDFDHTLNPRRFEFLKSRVYLENIVPLIEQGCQDIGIDELDLLSLDLDGNDYYFTKELLKSISPKVLVVEYNARFPPPVKWVLPYNENHSWDGTDYFGASLAAYCELLAEFSYRLICCNAATGANAFFVRNEYFAEFSEVPDKIEDIFVGCRYQLPMRWGHRPSPKTIERMLEIG